MLRICLIQWYGLAKIYLPDIFHSMEIYNYYQKSKSILVLIYSVFSFTYIVCYFQLMSNFNTIDFQNT